MSEPERETEPALAPIQVAYEEVFLVLTYEGLTQPEAAKQAGDDMRRIYRMLPTLEVLVGESPHLREVKFSSEVMECDGDIPIAGPAPREPF